MWSLSLQRMEDCLRTSFLALMILYLVPKTVYTANSVYPRIRLSHKGKKCAVCCPVQWFPTFFFGLRTNHIFYPHTHTVHGDDSPKVEHFYIVIIYIKIMYCTLNKCVTKLLYFTFMAFTTKHLALSNKSPIKRAFKL